MFRIVEEHTGTVITLVVSAVLFGATHLVNVNATLWGTLSLALTGGTMTAAAHVATRSLWLPISLHFATARAGPWLTPARIRPRRRSRCSGRTVLLHRSRSPTRRPPEIRCEPPPTPGPCRTLPRRSVRGTATWPSDGLGSRHRSRRSPPERRDANRASCPALCHIDRSARR
ncbi:CPBP family intramembrane glutamic endopeptidase [Nonomuraea sp. NPDC003201]